MQSCNEYCKGRKKTAYACMHPRTGSHHVSFICRHCACDIKLLPQWDVLVAVMRASKQVNGKGFKTNFYCFSFTKFQQRPPPVSVVTRIFSVACMQFNVPASAIVTRILVSYDISRIRSRRSQYTHTARYESACMQAFFHSATTLACTRPAITGSLSSH